MGGKIIQAATVASDKDGDLAVGAKAFTSFTGGLKTVVSAAIAEPLVAESTPCRGVWLGPPCSASGLAQNTQVVFIGDAVNQNMPVMPNNYEGYFINIADANQLYIKVGADGEGLQYRIFT